MKPASKSLKAEVTCVKLSSQAEELLNRLLKILIQKNQHPSPTPSSLQTIVMLKFKMDWMLFRLIKILQM